MSVKVTIKTLPHAVPHADIRDAQLRRVTMLLMENIRFLKSQLDTAQKAIIELQKKGG